MKYFSDIRNIKSLKERYLELIKEYHPVFHSENKSINYMEICYDIENEFKIIFKQLKDNCMFSACEISKAYGYVLMENIKANERKNNFINSVSCELFKLPVYKKYFDNDCNDDNCDVIKDGFIVSSGRDLVNEVFYSCFVELCLDIDDVVKIYELSDCNAEKFKRVILFLREGNLEFFDFRSNLYSDDSIPFFDDDIVGENIPDYNSSLIIISEISTCESVRGWYRFCNRQSECFDEKFHSKLLEKSKVVVKVK